MALTDLRAAGTRNLERRGAFVQPGEDVAYHAGANPVRNTFGSYTNAIQDRHNQFVEEAKRLGMTDPNEIDRYAMSKNADWGTSHGIDATGTWLERHPWAAPVGVLGAGLGAYGLGAAGVGAAGAGEAGASEAAGTGLYGSGVDEFGNIVGAGTGAGGGAGGSAGTGALTGSGDSGVVSGPGTADTSGGTSVGRGTAMSRILDGSATTADWLSLGGNVGSTLLGVAGSRNAANAYGNLAGTYMAFGAPSRARYEASMSPGFDPTTIPGYSGALDTASRGILARLAATGGNPYGNPGGLIEANRQIISGTALPAIEAYQRLNAGTGGYAGFNAAAPGASTAQIGAQGGIYNAVGSGLAGLTNPQPSIYDTLARLGVQGLT